MAKLSFVSAYALCHAHYSCWFRFRERVFGGKSPVNRSRNHKLHFLFIIISEDDDDDKDDDDNDEENDDDDDVFWIN